jgi:hypothetical protein
VREHFDQPDHGQAVRIDDGSDARFLHARPSAAEELDVRAPAAERVDKTGRVEVTGGFASGDENFGGH